MPRGSLPATGGEARVARWFALAPLLVAAAILGVSAAPPPTAKAIDQVNDCPIAISGFTDPWLRVGIEDPDERLADRNGDQFVCEVTLRLLSLPLARVVTDNAIGDPNVIPPGPCTDPSRELAVGPRPVAKWARQIDLNGDGLICGQGPPEPELPTLILVDNPNEISRG